MSQPSNDDGKSIYELLKTPGLRGEVKAPANKKQYNITSEKTIGK